MEKDAFVVRPFSCQNTLLFLVSYTMPNTSSAKKALKQNLTRQSRNRHFKAIYKETLKEFEVAVKTGDAKKAGEILPKVYSRLDTLVKKNILHVNNVARKKSAFAKKVRSLSAKA